MDSTVLFNNGEDRVDATCGDREVSIPHISVGRTSRNSERIFAAGNERTAGIMEHMASPDVGYKLQPGDEFAALLS